MLTWLTLKHEEILDYMVFLNKLRELIKTQVNESSPLHFKNYILKLWRNPEIFQLENLC